MEKYGIGIVINPENTEEMARSINGFLSDSALVMECRKNLKRARAELNWEEEEKKLISLYSELVAQGLNRRCYGG